MISASTIKNERLIFLTESLSDATVIKRGLAGKNLYLATAPYGNRVTPSTENNNLVLEKHTGSPFTYEEVRTLVKKIMAFGRISKEKAEEIMERARERLESRLTFFHPNGKQPRVEVSFSSNWVSFEFVCRHFDLIFKEVRDLVAETEGASVKVFSNNVDVVSIHNYSMQGLYLHRKTLDGIAEILAANEVLSIAEKEDFVTRVAAFNTKCVLMLEARQICQSSDEHFDMVGDIHYTPTFGNRNFLSAIMKIMAELSLRGDIHKLSKPEIHLLHSLLQKPDAVKEYHLDKSLEAGVVAFMQNFSQEIASAHKSTANGKL